MPSPTCVGNLGARIGPKGRRGRICSLCLSAWAEVPVFSCLPTDWTIRDFPSSQTFAFGLELYTDFPQSTACRWQIMRLLSPINHMGQVIYIYLILCFSGDLRLKWSIIEIKIQSFFKHDFCSFFMQKVNLTMTISHISVLCFLSHMVSTTHSYTYT